MIKGSRSGARGFRPKLESQNDEAYLTGRHTPKEKEQQIRTPFPREGGAGSAAPRSKRRK